MGIAPFIIALGDSPEVELQAGATVDIAPADNSVDTNRVRIVGTGPISSLGVACGAQTRAQYLDDPDDVAATDDVITVTKRVTFVPTAPGFITLKHNPPALSLLGGVDRKITTPSYGEYQSDVDGWWTELGFSRSDANPDMTQTGGLLAINNYTASGTITIPPYATRAWVRMWGATGASGPATTADGITYNYSGGVGSAGYLEKFLTFLTPGNTLIFTRGAGAPAPTGSNPGTKGGDSILASGTQTIGTLTARGSNGTSYSASPGSFGAPATGGDINKTGQSGGPGGNVGPGVGGAYGLSRGPDGSLNTAAGNAGSSGGLIIAWYSDPFVPLAPPPVVTQSWVALIAAQAPASVGAGYNDQQLRTRIGASVYVGVVPATATKIRVTLTGGGATTNSVKQVWVGHARFSSPTLDFDGAQVELKFSGNANANLPAGMLVSDAVDFAFDKTRDLIISFWNGGSSLAQKTGAPAAFVSGNSIAGGLGGASAGNDSCGFTGTQAGYVYMMALIEVFG